MLAGVPASRRLTGDEDEVTLQQPIRVEVCTDSLAGVRMAARAGVDRVEICAGWCEGGTTPSAGTIRLSVRESVPVVVLVRPRGGRFCLDDCEFEVVLEDVRQARRHGARGVATAALTADGRLARDRLKRIREEAGDMELTFHRAFDFTRDPAEALETLVEVGFRRVLTSGGAERALDGVERIAECVAQAAGRIDVVAAGGVAAAHLPSLLELTGVHEIHLSARRV